MLPAQEVQASAVLWVTGTGDRRRVLRDRPLPLRRRSPLPRQVSHAQTVSWFHLAREVATFNTGRALAARDHLLASNRDRALLAAILPSPPPSPHAVHPFAADSLQASLRAELPAPALDFAVLSRDVSPDLEVVLPLGFPVGLRSAASLTYPQGLSMMHEAGFCARPSRLREMRLQAVRMHAAARQLQRAWASTLAPRFDAELSRLRTACVLIQSATRRLLARLPLRRHRLQAWFADHDEAGPLPIHWDWYRLPTRQRCFFHRDMSVAMIVESSVERGQGWGRLGDLTFPPHWPPPWMQSARLRCGLPATRHPPPTPSLDADCSSDDCSDFGAGFGESGAFSDGEFYADEW